MATLATIAKQEIIEVDPNDLIPNPNNPRLDYMDISDIEQSIRANGVLEPIIVYRDPPGSPQLKIAEGHRRWFAAKKVGLKWMPAILDGRLEDTTAAERAFETNSTRRNLNHLEIARCLYGIMTLNHWELNQLHDRFPQHSNANIKDHLELLKWDISIQKLVAGGRLAWSVFAGVAHLLPTVVAMTKLPEGEIKEYLSRRMVLHRLDRIGQVEIIRGWVRENDVETVKAFLASHVNTPLSHFELGKGHAAQMLKQMSGCLSMARLIRSPQEIQAQQRDVFVAKAVALRDELGRICKAIVGD